jgi:uncharacterized membrane protein YadS
MKKEDKKNNISSSIDAKVGIPSFIIWFLFFTVLASFKILPKEIETIISLTSHYVSLIAMSAIGLMINFKTIKDSASKAFKVSTILFIMQLFLSATVLFILY